MIPKGYVCPALRNPPPALWADPGDTEEMEVEFTVTAGLTRQMKKAFTLYLLHQLECQPGRFTYYQRCLHDFKGGAGRYSLRVCNEFASFVMHLAGYTERVIQLDRSSNHKCTPRHGGWSEKYEA